ncbi:hypothetical protein GGI25_003379 [Coemansia spiralis]|uniref:NmrA-like domain-containing protein n=2 Tax=Coemansia TaxID=4863 RepID=A0A9W8G656_9FUNG|nr:hypothetical protein BX070DRAFT_263853 [Coemansia spiralis]KAJ1990918.1 hypothetical protein EDC05_003768 [Coemansia umbellata]KAJ2621697.1 hypothetical protein GGI26_003905 [Coemansia sp. RSA 1358]KAJ2676844.1 hypothetical protein GGI25_003379 [Coemansia spiralis]
MVADASYNRIAVVGTGGYGWHFLSALIHCNHFINVRAVTRRPQPAQDNTAKLTRMRQLRGLGIEVVEYAETTAEAFKLAFADSDIVVSAVGVLGVPDQIAMIDGALLAGVKWFIPSEYGVVHYPSKWMPFAGPLAAKGPVQDYLIKAAESKGLAYTVIYTGLALDYLDPRSIGLKLTKRTATLVGRGGSPVTFTSINDVVRLLVAIVQRPQDMQNRTIRYAGSTAKMRDLLKVVTGSNCGENLKIVSIDEAKIKFRELARNQDMKAFQIYGRLLIEEGLAQINRYQEPLNNDLFPEIEPEPISQTLERLIERASALDGLNNLKSGPVHRSGTATSVTDGIGRVYRPDPLSPIESDTE